MFQNIPAPLSESGITSLRQMLQIGLPSHIGNQLCGNLLPPPFNQFCQFVVTIEFLLTQQGLRFRYKSNHLTFPSYYLK
jgi:hypothetical protein